MDIWAGMERFLHLSLGSQVGANGVALIAVIEAVMDQIIAKNIFLTAGGALVSKRDIKLVDTTTGELYGSVAESP